MSCSKLSEFAPKSGLVDVHDVPLRIPVLQIPAAFATCSGPPRGKSTDGPCTHGFLSDMHGAWYQPLTSLHGPGIGYASGCRQHRALPALPVSPEGEHVCGAQVAADDFLPAPHMPAAFIQRFQYFNGSSANSHPLQHSRRFRYLPSLSFPLLQQPHLLPRFGCAHTLLCFFLRCSAMPILLVHKVLLFSRRRQSFQERMCGVSQARDRLVEWLRQRRCQQQTPRRADVKDSK